MNKLDTPLRVGEDDLTYLQGSNKPFTGTAVEWFESGQKKRETDFLNGLEHGFGRSWYEEGEVKGNVVSLFGCGQLKQEVELKNGVLNGGIVRYWREGGVEYKNMTRDGQPIGPSVFFDKDGHKEKAIFYRNGEQHYVVWYSKDGVRKMARGFVDGKFGDSAMFYDEFGEKDYKQCFFPGTNYIDTVVWYDMNGNILDVDHEEENDEGITDKTPVIAAASLALLTACILGAMSYAVLR